jgi:RNA polymerase sigma-70 factor, ECF subfamily
MPRPRPANLPMETCKRTRENERICRIVAGDDAAFRSLVREYHPLAYNLAYRVLGDVQDAEEVVQDAFIKIYRALDSFRGEASLKTWILRIVMRLSLNRRRDRARSSWRRMGLHRREAGTMDLPTVQNPEALYITDEYRQLLRRLVDQLSAPLRQVLILNTFEELSYEEISRVLDIPLGTVSSRISSARKQLLRALENTALQ